MRIKRLRETGSSGFTMVELLTVIVIIGVLAAIAIPSLFRHKSKGYAATVASDLRNAAAAQEAWAIDHNGYAVDPAQLAEEGFGPSKGVVIAVERTDSGGFCLSGYHQGMGDDRLYYGSTGSGAGAPSAESCA